MSETIIVDFNEDGNPTVAAYCLKTNSWHDYLAFKEDAKQAISREDHRNAKRFLRAALTCLFSHLEAVVNDIEENRKIPVVYPGTRLCDRTRNISQEAKRHRKISYLN